VDFLKQKIGELLEGQVGEQLQNTNLPTSQDEVVQQLEEKGVPDQLTDKVRNVDTSQLPNLDDLKSKIGL
jgi:hypothetical protein